FSGYFSDPRLHAANCLTAAARRLFEIFGAPCVIRMGATGGKHRSVRVGTPAARSGATIPGGGNQGPVADARSRLVYRLGIQYRAAALLLGVGDVAAYELSSDKA